MEWTTFAQAGQPPSNLIQVLFSFGLPIAFMFGVFYFLLIRPQRKQERARQDMLKALQKNDKVVTIGGVHGVVASVRPQDKTVVLKIDESGNVRVKVSLSAVARVVTGGEEGEAKD
jgi:preprotein translocase subunit YajC